MVDLDTFLTALYVVVDEICQRQGPEPPHPGPVPALSRSEVVTLAIFGQWAHFPSERAFLRFAAQQLRGCFPRLVSRSQFNRQLRQQQTLISQVALAVAAWLRCDQAAGEILDCAPAPIRNPKRRGSSWLAGLADVGRSLRLGWYYGFKVLTAVTPEGVITGWGCGPASANDRPLAETLVALRQQPDPRLPSAGHPARARTYLADTGFASRRTETRLRETYGVTLVASPQRGSLRRWPPAVRRWAAGQRQMVETVHGRLLHTFRLERDRPHSLAGFLTRVAAKAALHNFCCWLNHELDRPLLAVAELLDW